MSSKLIQMALTRGLLSGYGGKTVFAKVKRGTFSLNSSHFEDKLITYHDEWLPANTGGGQELVRVGSTQYTRIYAGGIISNSILTQLKITEGEIINFLKLTILDQKHRTRLFKSCLPKSDGVWQYTYQVLEKNPSISATLGKETIKFKGKTVFVHYFLLCPIGK